MKYKLHSTPSSCQLNQNPQNSPDYFPPFFTHHHCFHHKLIISAHLTVAKSPRLIHFTSEISWSGPLPGFPSWLKRWLIFEQKFRAPDSWNESISWGSGVSSSGLVESSWSDGIWYGQKGGGFFEKQYCLYQHLLILCWITILHLHIN